MSVDYLYLLGDSYTGAILGELPFTPTGRYTRQLTGCGAFSGTIPLDHDMATKANFKDRLPNLIVVRNGIVRWFGPVTTPTPDLSARTLALNAREPTWWMQKRCIEVDKHYHADTHYIFRRLWNYITTKTDAGSINAALASISVSSGNSGNTKRVVLSGKARHLMSDVVAETLAANPDTGIEWRVDFSGTLDAPQATIKLGSPLGSTLTHKLHQSSLEGYGLDMNNDPAGTRAHAVGAGYTSTKQNTGSVSAGFPLLDVVIDRSDTQDHDMLDDAAKELRRKAQPPVRVPDAEYTPHGDGLTFAFCDLGDKLPFGTTVPELLALSLSRRVVEIGVQPETREEPESVGLTFNLPLDELGT